MSAPDRYAVIGHPVRHSRSPFIHSRFAAQPPRGRVDPPVEAGPAAFARVVRECFAGGGKGLNVTVPHKEAAAQLVDELTPRAHRAGAVNTIAPRPQGGLLGDNTD